MITERNPTRFTCVGCRVKFDVAELQRSHFKTEWHLYNLKRKVCNLEPIDEQSFLKIQESAKVDQPEDQKSHARNSSESEMDEVGDTDDSDEWEDESEYEAEMLARVIKSDVCLFCDKKSTNIESNVRHMNSIHGFFIPEDQYLIDLEGMIEYLGFKVGAGGTCLWCNKQFSTVHGVRLHMLYKNHCKILYDQDKAIDEFNEFYDYSGQEHIPMKKPDQLMIKPKRHSDKTRTLVANRPGTSNSRQLIAKSNAIPMHVKKSVKKFDSYRAKILLRTGMANNDTKRSRLRLQNPM